MGGTGGQLSCRTKGVVTAPILGFFALRYVKLGYMKKHLDLRAGANGGGMAFGLGRTCSSLVPGDVVTGVRCALGI